MCVQCDVCTDSLVLSPIREDQMIYSKSFSQGDCSRINAGSGNRTSAPVDASDHKSNLVPLGLPRLTLSFGVMLNLILMLCCMHWITSPTQYPLATASDVKFWCNVECCCVSAYTSFYIVGLLLSMQIPFVGFQPIRTSEHMAAAGNVFFFQGFRDSIVNKRTVKKKLF